MKRRRHRAFPKTFATVRRAKSEGMSAEQVWQFLKTGVRESGMRPSGQAMALTEYRDYVIDVYGEEGKKACDGGAA